MEAILKVVCPGQRSTGATEGSSQSIVSYQSRLYYVNVFSHVPLCWACTRPPFCRRACPVIIRLAIVASDLVIPTSCLVALGSAVHSASFLLALSRPLSQRNVYFRAGSRIASPSDVGLSFLRRRRHSLTRSLERRLPCLGGRSYVCCDVGCLVSPQLSLLLSPDSGSFDGLCWRLRVRACVCVLAWTLQLKLRRPRAFGAQARVQRPPFESPFGLFELQQHCYLAS
jgi:hypothetical protein